MFSVSRELQSWRLFMASGNVLWITRGSQRENPYAAMTVGFFRSLREELQHTQLQLLDIDESKKASATFLAERLLRLEVAAQRKTSGSSSEILWSTEPELI